VVLEVLELLLELVELVAMPPTILELEVVVELEEVLPQRPVEMVGMVGQDN
jgi:hypothetical protein